MNGKHGTIIDNILESAEAIRRTVESAPTELLDRRPAEGEWSVTEILSHVRNVVMLAYGQRIRRLFVETEPQFPDYDEGRYLRSADWRPLQAGESLDMILAEHRQIAALLSTLPDEAWSRAGYHPESGALTIEYLARRIAEHAEEHQRQIAETLRLLSA
ncbi:MAG: DinB family protein [Chloroflexota bacterium]|jgi:hypothetical protein